MKHTTSKNSIRKPIATRGHRGLRTRFAPGAGELVDVRIGSTKTTKMGCFNFQTLEASPYPFNLSNVKKAFFVSDHGVR